MRKLNIMSPGKLEAPPPSPTHSCSPKRLNHEEDNLSAEEKKCGLSPLRPHSLPSINKSLDVIDLEKVICDFETEYLSPTKQNGQQISNNKFVKKMVAIFEKKTMITKYSKSTLDNLERRKSSPDIINESSNEYFIPKNDINTTERQRKYVDSNLVDCSKSIVNYESNEPFDDGSSEASVQSASEIIMSDSIWDLRPPRSNESLKRERAPKIIGAFLKKPIQVENTTIDWLPMTPTKSPSRKKSFSKIISLLTGKKIWENNIKNSLLRRKLRKYSKESQDSGYDEKSGSSTPTTLESISSSFRNALLHEENNPHDINERAPSMSTFQSFDPPQQNKQTEEDSFSNDLIADDKTKIMFEDIPRSEVRLSLGPFYPVHPKLFRKPLDRKDIIKETIEETLCQCPSNNENEYQNNIPLISQSRRHSNISESEEKYGSSSKLFDEEFNQDQLQNDVNWIFPSLHYIYDVPRYSSISEPGMINSYEWEYHTDNNLYESIQKLNIPKVNILPRPKSSVYDDAQSLKRRSDGVNSIFGESQTDFYASPTANRPKYATIKPRNSRRQINREFLSIESFNTTHTFTVPNSHDHMEIKIDTTCF
ncbi:hypothetical protein PV327_005495 [Microctonus hyperodae]|uniref:Uncharacterized protein n=1 Tax=Microctonus hyperodae TaxID=165561 RepID=A0AA39G1H0_MICHY|nr:hypothetical protein PV327_005495 [Microctonus hyperodae]